MVWNTLHGARWCNIGLSATLSLCCVVAAACGSEEPKKKPAPEPVKTCAEKYAGAPAWTINDQSALKETKCVETASGLWACNKRGTKYDCFDCKAVKTTFDPNDGGPGSFKALGVDDAALVTLQNNYDTGCVSLVDWDQYEPDGITRHLICKEAMTGLKVCRNIDGKRQWWNIDGAGFIRRQVAATIGNSKGSAYILDMPNDKVEVLDLASWPFLACDDLAATKAPGWDLWISVAGDQRSVKLDLVEPKTAAAEPQKTDFERLASAFLTCDDSYGNWE